MNYNIFMTKIKESAILNTFYTSNVDELKNQIQGFKESVDFEYEYKSRAVIVPHAGLIYSGALAYKGINQLEKNIKNIFIFAPAHREMFEGLALSGYDEWKTPLGNIKINQEVNSELIDTFEAQIYDKAHELEHSIEIEIPIIQSLFEDVEIIPVLVGIEGPDIITKIISKYYPNPDFGFVISSDLSHFLKDDEAKKVDSKTAQMIESGNLSGFKHSQACGAIGIAGVCQFASLNNYSLIRVGMYNSSLTSNDKSRVVGYGSWMLFEGSKNQFIKKYYSTYILKLCKNVILSKFDNSDLKIKKNAVFDELGAAFVTLKKQGNLRGCIGSIIAHRPLIKDLIAHSINAAFNDPRFNPLKKEEVDELEIDVSILSEPEQIEFSDEADLLDKIVPFKDGIIIRDEDLQAVYLPSVWEELSDKELFLQSLKIKAGMHPKHFSKTFEAYRFEVEYIS